MIIVRRRDANGTFIVQGLAVVIRGIALFIPAIGGPLDVYGSEFRRQVAQAPRGLPIFACLPRLAARLAWVNATALDPQLPALVAGGVAPLPRLDTGRAGRGRLRAGCGTGRFLAVQPQMAREEIAAVEDHAAGVADMLLLLLVVEGVPGQGGPTRIGLTAHAASVHEMGESLRGRRWCKSV